jgi:capsular exopolysaccharide synthesis family protein
MNMMRLPQRPVDGSRAVDAESTNMSGSLPGIDLEEQLRILWRQKGLILGTVIVIMLLAFVVISSLTPRYKADVLVEINPRQTNIVDFEAVLSGLPTDTATIQTELKIIQSRQIARRAVARLKLLKDPEFNSRLRPGSLMSSWNKSLAAWLASLGGQEVADGEEAIAGQNQGEENAQSANPSEDGGAISKVLRWFSEILNPTRQMKISEDERVKREEDRVIDTFLSKLSVSIEGRSRIARISFESKNPETATAVANTIADFYIVAQLEAKFEATKRATTWLNERVEQLRQEVEANERAVEEFRARSGLLQGGGDATLTEQQVSELNAQYMLELARLAETQARLNQSNDLLSSPSGIESAVEVQQSPLIRDFRIEEARLERAIAEFSEEYGERHPNMINARAELRDLRSKIKIEVDRVIQGLRNEVAVVRARTSSLASSLEKAKGRVAKLNQSEVDLRSLEREANASRTLLETLLQRTKQTTSQESFQQADASVVSYASLPRSPSFPKKRLLLPLIFIFAIIQGIVLAYMIERLDLGFRSAEQIARQMGVSSLGLIPSISKLATLGRTPHDYVLQNPGSAYGEGIRSLYTNLLLSDVVQRPNVILVTSALPREGKTSVVLSLGRMLSSMGHRVIVVDGDLRKPSIHKDLGVEPGPGLTDCLSGHVAIDDVIQEDQISGLHFLQAGTPKHHSPDQLDSQHMERLLRHLARKYDLVILDSAPILAVSDTLFVARLVDKTVFLVRWARTRRAAANLALSRILAADADVAGAALTMVDVKSHAQYGYGDSGSYHGALKKYYTA